MIAKVVVFILVILWTSHNGFLCFGFATQSIDQIEKLGGLLFEGGLDTSKYEAEMVSGPGFCNTIYRLNPKDGIEDAMIAKIFSAMAKQRMDPSVPIGHYDILASKHGIGPKLVAASEHGILMECLPGCVLTEEDTHHENGVNLSDVAKCVARFHQMERQNQITQRCNMLWHSMDIMVELCSRDFVLAGEWSTMSIMDEICRMKERIEKWDLPVVLGHGDLKPSNVMSGVRLIDFELSGLNYRGYDLAKLFRTRNPTPHTEAHQDAFYLAYVDETNRLLKSTHLSTDSAILGLESKILESLTWLEAAVFFLCSSNVDPDRKNEWRGLAWDRFKSYEKARTKIDTYGKLYMSLKRH